MKWVYWLLVTFLYFYQFIFRSLFATLGDEVTATFHLSVEELSTFLSSAMLTYAIMQIPGGVLIDKFGPRKLLSIAMAALSGGVILIGLTDSFGVVIFARLLMGFGSAFGFLGTSIIVSMWFPSHMMPVLLGSTVFIGSLGGAFSREIFLPLTVGNWDWRGALIIMGLIGAVSIFLFAFFLKEKPGQHSTTSTTKRTSLLSDLKFVMMNKQVLLASFFTFFAYIPISVIADSWGVTAFEKMFGVTRDVANQTLAYFYLPFSFGAFFYSAIASLIKNSRIVLIFECIIMFAALGVLLIMTDVGASTIFGIPGFLLLTSVVAFNVGGVSLAFPIGCSHMPKQFIGTTAGVINMFCMISGSIYAKLIGWLLNFYWDGAVGEDGLPLYSGAAYQSAFQPLLVGVLLAIVLLFFMREGRMNLEPETV